MKQSLYMPIWHDDTTSNAMTLNQRQLQVVSTMTETCANEAYPLFGVIEEHGELIEKMLPMMQWHEFETVDGMDLPALKTMIDDYLWIAHHLGKLAKAIRHGTIPPPFTIDHNTEYYRDMRHELRLEIGDCKWNDDALDAMLLSTDRRGQRHLTAHGTACANFQKLNKRKADDMIDGQGDHERSEV